MKKIIVTSLLSLLSISACSPTSGDDISAYTRDTTSGTRSFFMKSIGAPDAATNDTLLNDNVQEQNNAGILAAVSDYPGAIGYVSLSGVNSNVKKINVEGIEATEETVIDQSYPMARNFNYMVRDDLLDNAGEIDCGKGNKAIATSIYLNYIKSTEGLASIASAHGIVDLTSGYKFNELATCSKTVSSETIIRIGGSDSVEKISRAIKTSFEASTTNIILELDHTGSGDAFKRTNGSQKNEVGTALEVGYSSREFKTSETATIKGVISKDAIAVIVNRENEINNITLEQLKRIYTNVDSQIYRWSQINLIGEKNGK